MIINDLKDAIREIKRLNSILGEFERGLLDMKGGRIKNAAPSADGSDYVTRDELLRQIIERVTGTKKGESLPADYDIGVFGLGINSQLVIKNDAAPHHIVASHAGTANLVEVRTHTKDVAIGGGVTIKLWRLRKQPILDLVDTVELCTIHHPANNDRVQTYTGPFANSLNSYDRIRVDVGAVGTSTRGGNMIIKMKYVWSS